MDKVDVRQRLGGAAPSVPPSSAVVDSGLPKICKANFDAPSASSGGVASSLFSKQPQHVQTTLITDPLPLDGTGVIDGVDHCDYVVDAFKALPNGVVPDIECTQTVIDINRGVEYDLAFIGNPGVLKQIEIAAMPAASIGIGIGGNGPFRARIGQQSRVGLRALAGMQLAGQKCELLPAPGSSSTRHAGVLIPVERRLDRSEQLGFSEMVTQALPGR